MVRKIGPKRQNAAIFYKPEAYTTKTTRILGRRAAGEGFLKAYVESQKGQTLYCHCDNQSEFDNFRETVTPWLTQQSQLVFIPRSQPYRIQDVGTLYVPGRWGILPGRDDSTIKGVIVFAVSLILLHPRRLLTV